MPPVVATIIVHFQSQAEWALDDLAAVMEVPADVVKRRIAYWQGQGMSGWGVGQYIVLRSEILVEIYDEKSK